MARSQELQTASFMMLCLGEYSSKLRIPAKFVLKYRELYMKVPAILETGGKYWEVKIEDDNGELYMKDGWSEFVKDNNITLLDFLTFRLISDSTFKVSIFTPDGCPRLPITSPASASASGRNHVMKKKRERRSEESNPLYFEVYLKKQSKTRFNLRKKFCDAAGIRGKKYVRLENAAKRICKFVEVIERSCGANRTVIDLTGGWRGFREAIGLDIGQSCSFRYDPDTDVIRVEEIKISNNSN